MKQALFFSVARRLAGSMVLAGVMVAIASAARAQDPEVAAPLNQNQEIQRYAALSNEQLDELVGPIALYADPLLAQVLLAATYSDQIHDAAVWVRANGTGGVDDQPWDVSVKAVAHYPTVLNMMEEKADWTAALGQAYANQSTDVMQSVQHLRSLAKAKGNLATTPQQEVVVRDDNIAIWPAQPNVIYVPVYDPDMMFYGSGYGSAYGSGFGYGYQRPYFAFGMGYPIGSWLVYDWDWPGRRIYYTGWSGGGWIGRSRPYVRLNSWYVNDRFRNVSVNRSGTRRFASGSSWNRTSRPFSGTRSSTPNVVRRGGGERAAGSTSSTRGAQPNRRDSTPRPNGTTRSWSPPASSSNGYRSGASSPRSAQPGYTGRAQGGVPRSSGYTGSAQSGMPRSSGSAGRAQGSVPRSPSYAGRALGSVPRSSGYAGQQGGMPRSSGYAGRAQGGAPRSSGNSGQAQGGAPRSSSGGGASGSRGSSRGNGGGGGGHGRR